jgi:hypothetical protein
MWKKKEHPQLDCTNGRSHALAATTKNLVLKAAEFVSRSLPSPSKFSPNWDGPYIVREVHGSGYYRLSKSDGTILADPINEKWLKHYY